MIIYHNPHCNKSRQALALLQEKDCETTVIEYLKNPLTANELDAILKKLKMEPQELIRKDETLYKVMGLANKKFSRDEWINVMVENPILIERPIVVNGRQAAIGRPPENVLSII